MGINLEACSCLRPCQENKGENEIQTENYSGHNPPMTKKILKNKELEKKTTNPFSDNISIRSMFTDKMFFQNKNSQTSQSTNNNNFEMNKIEEDATKIQSFYRGFSFRKKISEESNNSNNNNNDNLSDKFNDNNNNNNEQNSNSSYNELIERVKEYEKLFEKEFDIGKGGDDDFYNIKPNSGIVSDEIPVNNNHLNLNLKDVNNFKTEFNGEECLYNGQIDEDNIINGKGKLYTKSGKMYEGSFINGKLNGWGKLIDDKGVCYEGIFNDNEIEGKGEILRLDENNKIISYKGDIKNFKKEGQGKEKTPDYIYDGEFLNDLKDGHGRLEYVNSDGFYEGQFSKGFLTGKGFYKWDNQHTYEGDFVDGKMHGRGVYKWPDGSHYEGEYKDNVKEGEGEFRWKDGKIFRGHFSGGKPDGKGMLTIKGVTVEAEFKDGKCLGDLKSVFNSKKSEIASKISRSSSD